MNYSKSIKKIWASGSILLLSACATYAPQTSSDLTERKKLDKKAVHTFYIAGGFGNMGDNPKAKTLSLLTSHLSKADSASTLLLTGDNISAYDNWKKNKVFIDRQLTLTEGFKGNTIFIPGNNEWESYNTEKIEKVEKYLDDKNLDGIKFYPKNVCPIEHKVINDDLDLIIIDSKWFISNWSRIENINKKCTDIVTRRRFAEELEGYINDGQGKNIIIAMHHPIFSNGVYAGKQSFKSNMVLLPLVGSVRNGLMNLGAFSPDLLNSRRYNYLRILVSSLAKASDRITLVSGHEESLQYLNGGNIHQIISGSLSKNTVTRRSKDRINTIGGSLSYEGKYSHGIRGFAKLIYFEDGSSQVTFIDEHGEETDVPILSELKSDESDFKFSEQKQNSRKKALVDDYEEINKSRFYKFLWGNRYRKYFGKSVTAPVALLDTLYGGLKVTKEGGGHQSYSIRLEDKNGKEYSMRSLRKNALKFLKFKVPGVAYTQDDYDDTFTEEVISDFFSTAHPYMQLVINPLAKAVNVNHSSPSLFYIPKQEPLGELNEEFGDELYFIEERPSDEQLNFKGYKRTINESGKINEFESTTDMFEKIRSDESYTVDQKDFIRARIFDMLIGDWDRHQDQWRWVEYETKEGDKTFLPIPRDRDNAFPKFDGTAMKFIKLMVPNARRWQSYGPEVKNVKWLNVGGNQVDRALLTRFGPEVWVEEAQFIQENLTEADIDNAFNRLPLEVQDETAKQIRENLKDRLTYLTDYAHEYAVYLDKLVALHATEKDDKITVTRLPDGKTRVVMKRLLSNETDELMFDRTFDSSKTDEIWIYGLGDDDKFEVSGERNNKILVRLVGGYGKDVFNISNKNSVKVYDWKHEEIEFTEKIPRNELTDVYKTNTHHWRFFEENSNVVKPNIGFRTDDGFYLGATNIYKYNGFNGNDFKQKHSLAANYYFKFKAIELDYSGIYANIFPKWNFEMNGYYTNDSYSNNFFGIGNETLNLEDDLGRDYYRARLQKIRFDAGIAYHTLRLKALFESYKVKELSERFFVPSNLNSEVFGSQNYVGLETSAKYNLADAKDFPSKSITMQLAAGYKANTNIGENQFGYLEFKAGFSHKLIPSGNLVFGTLGEVRTNFGNNYFFYHAPSLGGNNGLRGFRDERFTGKTYFYQSSDLRLRLKRYITAIAPITVGVYGGFDYGRVWSPADSSNVWHTSQGIGFWASGVDFITLSAGYFNSVEGNLVQVGFGFAF
ncbi:hypothetical protein B0O79_1547 [Flavobacteriaceae bacterium MAR_2009_75]|nr:hypothetical protein B0O79_1547 [Flavobacteriaceae bacterium MAR_2009_75]